MMTSRENTSNATELRCKKCGGTGWELFTDEEGVKRTRKCECGIYDKMIMEQQRSFADIPEVFKDYRVDTFKTTVYKDKAVIAEASRIIRYWFQHMNEMIQDGVGLYISSNTRGSGKTRMAASIANELMDAGYPVKFATSVQIITDIKATWEKSNSESESKLIRNLSTIKVLVFDDFGTEVPADWIGERFYNIINERYVRNLPTIYTSNLRLGQLQYDERITNRILEKTLQVVFPEESIRKQIAEQREREALKIP